MGDGRNRGYRKPDSRQTWHELKPLHNRQRFEGSAPIHYEVGGSEAYRQNFEAIDWSDDGKKKPDGDANGG